MSLAHRPICFLCPKLNSEDTVSTWCTEFVLCICCYYGYSPCTLVTDVWGSMHLVNGVALHWLHSRNNQDREEDFIIFFSACSVHAGQSDLSLDIIIKYFFEHGPICRDAVRYGLAGVNCAFTFHADTHCAPCVSAWKREVPNLTSVVKFGTSLVFISSLYEFRKTPYDDIKDFFPHSNSGSYQKTSDT